MEAILYFETLVTTYKTTWRHNREPPENGGDKFFRNVGKHLQGYTASKSRMEPLEDGGDTFLRNVGTHKITWNHNPEENPSEEGCDMFLRNVGNHLHDRMTSQPRRSQLTSSPP
jgi:hypothetical protein